MTEVAKLGYQPRFVKSNSLARLIGSNGETRWKLDWRGRTTCTFAPDDRVYEMEIVSYGRIDSLNSTGSQIILNEKTLGGDVIRSVKTAQPYFLEGARNKIAANGMLRMSGHEGIVSFSLEGRLAQYVDSQSSLIKRGKGVIASATPLGYSDGLLWIYAFRRLNESPFPRVDEQVALVDAESGKIVNHWMISDFRELDRVGQYTAASRVAFFFRADSALVAFERGEMHVIHKQPVHVEGKIKGEKISDYRQYCPLRQNGFVTYRGGEITTFTRDWKIRRIVKSDDLNAVDPIELPFALVSFGFP